MLNSTVNIDSGVGTESSCVENRNIFSESIDQYSTAYCFETYSERIEQLFIFNNVCEIENVFITYVWWFKLGMWYNKIFYTAKEPVSKKFYSCNISVTKSLSTGKPYKTRRETIL